MKPHDKLTIAGGRPTLDERYAKLAVLPVYAKADLGDMTNGAVKVLSAMRGDKIRDADVQPNVYPLAQ